jgi:hypothetical protein
MGSHAEATPLLKEATRGLSAVYGAGHPDAVFYQVRAQCPWPGAVSQFMVGLSLGQSRGYILPHIAHAAHACMAVCISIDAKPMEVVLTALTSRAVLASCHVMSCQEELADNLRYIADPTAAASLQQYAKRELYTERETD